MEDSDSSFEELNRFMVRIELEDKIISKHFYKFILIPFKSTEVDLHFYSENALFRFHTPLAQQITDLLNGVAKTELPELFRGRLIELVKGYRIIFFWLDKLPVIDFVPVNTPKYTISNLDTIRWQLGPHYPDKIESTRIIIVNPEYPGGSTTEFTNWSKSDGVFLKNLFETYDIWFKHHAGNIIPKFQEIADEIGEYLKSETKIKPNQDGFIKWFIDNRLGVVKSKVTISGELNSLKATMQHDYSNLRNILTPTIIRDDLQAYCEWVIEDLRKASLERKQDKEDRQEVFTSSTQTVTSKPFTEIELKQYVRSTLAPLGGKNRKRQPIMSQEDFERLIIYTNHLVLTDTLPANIFPIRKADISIGHISYTYYLLYKQLLGNKNTRSLFCDFLLSVFEKFDTYTAVTMRSKLSYCPKSYYIDFAGYFGDKS